jgi:hypothetical protein
VVGHSLLRVFTLGPLALPPSAFTIRWEGEVDRGVKLHDSDPTPCPTELWSVWEGSERVGELEGEATIGTARVHLWDRSCIIGAYGGDSPPEKFQRWIVSAQGMVWIDRARQADKLS